MKFWYSRYKDHIRLAVYLLVAAMTPVLASLLIARLHPVVL